MKSLLRAASCVLLSTAFGSVASAAGESGGNPPPWQNPSYQKLDAAQRQDLFEYTDRFTKLKTRPPRQLRILEATPNAYEHPDKLPPTLLLGDLLYHAPKLLGPHPAIFGASCASCHPNGATTPDVDVGSQCTDHPGNVDLLSSFFTPLADDGVFAPRNVPSLRGIRYTAPYNRDGSKGSLREAIDGVLRVEFQQKVRTDWIDALSLYVSQFDFVPNKQIDELGRLTSVASADAHAGEKLFAQGRPQFAGMSCASCHVPESFFTDHRTHPMRHGEGVGNTVTEEGFKTVTLLDTSETAPYFFDGSAQTMAAAVKQIDSRHKLGLSDGEQKQLTAYLEAIGAEDVSAAIPTTRERMDGTLAYLSLLLTGPMQDDAELWPIALDTVRHDLRGAVRDAPANVRHSIDPVVKSYEGWVASSAHQKPSAENRQALASLREKLVAASHALNEEPRAQNP